MKFILPLAAAALLAGCSQSAQTSKTEATTPTQPAMNNQTAAASAATSVHDFTMKDISGKDVPLASYQGKVLLIVNVASKCGLTPQYAEIQEFYDAHKAKGLVVLGFPANNFGAQEPGSEEEIATFCKKNYGVSFPMFSKISVKGDDMHPLYQYLTTTTGEPVKWNFQKFLVGKDGKVIRSFGPQTLVTDAEVAQAVQAAL